MDSKTLERWVAVGDVADHLGFSRAWVYSNLPLLPHVRMGREYRFRLTLVDEWFASYLEGDV